METEKIRERAIAWTGPEYDEATRAEVTRILNGSTDELTECFHRDLEFGTGGLRGIMGAGTNRMNRYTVSAATQGLSNYLKKSFPNHKISVAIAHDSRNNSRYFAEVTAAVLSANDITAYLFPALRPTPELSFAVRHLKCNAGIVITASHNPKEYNGYKVYWEDGGQLVSPHDTNVIAEVRRITSLSDIRFNKNESLIREAGKDVDEAYLEALTGVSMDPQLIRMHSDLNILYTPLHGTGITMVPAALKKFGFTNINIVEAQSEPDGNFPTTPSPNPEERAALSMAIDKAGAIEAELILATDPDADRVGAGIPDGKGGYRLLNGNQTATLLVYYLIHQWKDKKQLSGKEYIVKTIVTSELIKEIATRNGVKCYDVLTGFKYIAEILKMNEGKMKFIGGGEESYGFLAADFVRDKDAVMTCALIAETLCWAKSRGTDLMGLLNEIYKTYGYYHEALVSLTKKGISGQQEIAAMMTAFRATPPAVLGGSRVTKIRDYVSRQEKETTGGKVTPISLPVSDVLQFLTADGSIVTVRPSGTEPKIKFYFGVTLDASFADDPDKAEIKAAEKIKGMMADMKL